MALEGPWPLRGFSFFFFFKGGKGPVASPVFHCFCFFFLEADIKGWSVMEPQLWQMCMMC